ncbi:hypothetical protein CDD83_10845 [Cordyceps sp. RAO-2017]|nr:hypothetical protein CDD83_10845 [Cordyceps sp. RAO-2017]
MQRRSLEAVPFPAFTVTRSRVVPAAELQAGFETSTLYLSSAPDALTPPKERGRSRRETSLPVDGTPELVGGGQVESARSTATLPWYQDTSNVPPASSSLPRAPYTCPPGGPRFPPQAPGTRTLLDTLSAKVAASCSMVGMYPLPAPPREKAGPAVKDPPAAVVCYRRGTSPRLSRNGRRYLDQYMARTLLWMGRYAVARCRSRASLSGAPKSLYLRYTTSSRYR